jgi:hypothetical protein
MLGHVHGLVSVLVLLNFYLYILIHYYFTASLDVFYHCFFARHFDLLTLIGVLS